MDKINVAVVGATGYAGAELTRILHNHKYANVKYLTSNSYLGQEYSNVYQNFKAVSKLVCTCDDLEEISKDVDVIFLALPHGIASKKVNENILKNAKIIDLGADFRLKDKTVYENWYKTEHFSPHFLQEAVYGLPEVYRDKIKSARLIANPGCYTTCSILGLYPLLKKKLIDINSIIVDAKSGVSGSGRTSSGIQFCEVNESIKAYKISSHRHTPEIEQELSFAAGKSVTLVFTPHLVPMNRGILVTSYAKLNPNIGADTVKNAYQEMYQKEIFARLLNDGIYPETKWVKGTNFVDISINFDKRTNCVIIVSAIDNLVKGAAGQAVQNMNIMFGLSESEGLLNAGIFPA